MNKKVREQLLHQVTLLRKELDWERNEYIEQSEIAGIERLRKKGVCKYPIEISRRYYNSLGQYLIDIKEVRETSSSSLFDVGKSVIFFAVQTDSKTKYLPIKATISAVYDDGKVVLELEDSSAFSSLYNRSNIGVQLHLDTNSYKQMFAALTQVMQANDNRAALLRDILLDDKNESTQQNVNVVNCSWLNNQQQAAVQKVVSANEVAVIHGPPGTGKTTTLVEAIYETLRRENQVLVCAQSNMAVDWIAEKLVDRGIAVMRIGNPSKINDKILGFTYERKVAEHTLYGQLKRLRHELNLLYRKSKGKSKGAHIREKIEGMKERITLMSQKIEEDVFTQARVIVSTLVGCTKKELLHRRFSTLFIDEAAQALQGACWIPILKSSRVIFAGDHCQLPPTVKCLEAQRGGLAQSLMEVVVQKCPTSVILLDTQYRMNQQIMGFPSKFFYDDRVKSSEDVKDRVISPLDVPIEWISPNDKYEKEIQTDNGSRSHKQEALALITYLERYIKWITIEKVKSEAIDIGIISPYRGQLQLLRQLIKASSLLRSIEKHITVATVDGFQGQERDVVCISMVRSNTEKQIGFLSDLRRMNVAITRARMKLIVIGDIETLRVSSFYQNFYNYIKELNQ